MADAFFDNIELDTSCEFGSIGLDCKRPFGNSYVEGDILEILGIEIAEYDTDEYREQCEYVRDLYYEELIPYLKKQWKKNK